MSDRRLQFVADEPISCVHIQTGQLDEFAAVDVATTHDNPLLHVYRQRARLCAWCAGQVVAVTIGGAYANARTPVIDAKREAPQLELGDNKPLVFTLLKGSKVQLWSTRFTSEDGTRTVQIASTLASEIGPLQVSVERCVWSDGRVVLAVTLRGGS